MENVVTKGAKAAEPMEKVSPSSTPGQMVQDLGGPTPENYKYDDDSAKLDASAPLKPVKDVVNKGAKPADGMEKVTAEPPQGGTTDSRSSGEGMEKVDAKVPGQSGKYDGKMKEEVEVEDEEIVISEINVDEDVTALLNGEGLSEEFEAKARTIFEAAIRNKVAIVKEELQAQYEATLSEELESIRDNLSERVDAYLEYVADEWMAENAIAVEHGLKSEITESFLSGMKELFEAHYVSIPEERYDVVESMVEKLDEMESQLNEQIERNVALNSRLAGATAGSIFSEVAEGLAMTQRDKLQSLAENVEFDSEEGYREKLESLKESYFPSRTTVSSRNSVEDLTEEVGLNESYSADVTDTMASYLQIANRLKPLSGNK